MFSLKAIILYILFFIIGWLLARWLWSKKQAEQASLSNRSSAASSGSGHSSATSSSSTTSMATGDTSSSTNLSNEQSEPAEPASLVSSTKKAPEAKAKSAGSEDVGAESVKPATTTASKSTAGTSKSKSAKSAVAQPVVAKTKAKTENDATKPERLSAARDGEADDLKRIKGIGKKNEEKLNAFGIYHFDQIGNWTDKQAEWIGSELSFPGRIEREGWIEQAKVLASGGDTEFSRRVDKGKVSSSKS